MSLILDALNKADQERSERREVPGLRAVHGSPYPEPRLGALKRWSVEIGFVALLLIAYLAYQLLAKDARPLPARPAVPGASSVQSVASPASLSELPGAEVPPAEPGVTRDPLTEPALAVAPPAVVVPPPAVAASAVATMVPPVEAPRSPTPAQDIKALYAGKRSGSLPVRDVQPPQVLPSGPAAAPAVQRSQPGDAALELKARLGKLPLLSELSEQKQRAIPSIDFSLHVYSSDRSAGFVTLNGQRRRQGDDVGSGLRLENIVDEFIVLNYQGTRFRLLSLNSWINLQ